MQRPKDLQLSQNEQVQDDFGAVSSCAILLPDINMTDKFLPARPDDEQIIKSIGDINADLPAPSTIHFTTSPFFIHEPNKLMSSPGYSPVSNVPLYFWDTIAPRRRHIFKFGVG